MAMTERKVEQYIREYLLGRGWKIRKAAKQPGEHGVDIHAWHPKWRRLLYIEAKGGSGKHKHSEIHNAFPAVLGQILSRMDKEGNHPKKARIYAIVIPYSWFPVFKKKIQKMKYGWRLLKLRVFLVKDNGEVMEKPHSHMLRKQ